MDSNFLSGLADKIKAALSKKENKKKEQTFWYKGKLLTKEEHDKLPWAKVHAYNNIVGRKKYDTILR